MHRPVPSAKAKEETRAQRSTGLLVADDLLGTAKETFL